MRQVLGRGPGEGSFWQAGLLAGLRVGQALRCSSYLGLGSAVPAPQIPGHPTAVCDKGVKQLLNNVTVLIIVITVLSLLLLLLLLLSF